ILPAPTRFAGGRLRVMDGPQSALFDAQTRKRAFATRFTAGAANRQGVALVHDGAPFASQTAGLLSDFITPGDIQTTGAGTPTILLADCQTIGGYPRLGTVIPADLPVVAQARPGTALWFVPITLDEAAQVTPPEPMLLAGLRKALRPLIRRPHDIPDLLGYQLISGVVRGDEEA
ncbi:urea amidolyase, partial [Rhodobacter sp. TJ_12]|nr:urea amidolyase [Rhodobacter sp. TJ_12]